MAKINGIYLKKIATFKDHEGMDIHSADVWLGNEKNLFWEQSFKNGEIQDRDER